MIIYRYHCMQRASYSSKMLKILLLSICTSCCKLRLKLLRNRTKRACAAFFALTCSRVSRSSFSDSSSWSEPGCDPDTSSDSEASISDAGAALLDMVAFRARLAATASAVAGVGDSVFSSVEGFFLGASVLVLVTFGLACAFTAVARKGFFLGDAFTLGDAFFLRDGTAFFPGE